ncbi:MAG: redox-sensing transcriptional repressor Rex [Planctomycetaceae bacterium]|jgi:redox-sensing transcriptional repressor|nr:redox-sensing transcriptional repressor Rex [Planctomycetaceae bacterium]
MAENTLKNYPTPSVQRLPAYLRLLKELKQQGEKFVSCTRIADEFGQLSVQIRKDLAMTGIIGRPKVGYDVDDLIQTILAFLGWNNQTTAFLAGAGSLGSAILGYEGFVEHNLEIVTAFDTDPRKIGTKIHNRLVRHSDEIIAFGKKHPADIGILTVPAVAAQQVANLFVNAGVRGIWNYTPVRLELPPHIVCEQVKLSASFAVLSSSLRSRSNSRP